MLDNYEASRGYFPILWKENYILNLLIGKTNMFETCIYWKSNPYNPETKQVDYILVMGERPGEECFEKTKKFLDSESTIIYTNKNYIQYKTNKKSL